MRKRKRKMGCLGRVRGEELSQHGCGVPTYQAGALSLLLASSSCFSKVLQSCKDPMGFLLLKRNVLGKDVCFVNMSPCRLVYWFNISILWGNETLILFSAVFSGQHLQVPLESMRMPDPQRSVLRAIDWIATQKAPRRKQLCCSH